MRTLTAALSIALAAPAQNVEAPAKFATARAVIAAQVDGGDTPSIAIAVLEDGEVVWAEGFGLIDVARERTASADSIYRLASISKPITATAIMQLVERGLVDLDAPVNRYLDEPLRAMRGRDDDITVRRLLNHTGGLPTHWNFFYEPEQPPPRPASIRAFGFAAFDPGTVTNYSNFAFGVLDHVIARVGEKGYRGWLVEELLDPLGMGSTDVGVRPGKEEHAAVGYRKEGDEWVAIPDYGFDHDGASAVRSSARDLMRFARLQLAGGTVDGRRLLDEASVLAMRARTASAAGSSFGIGWSTDAVRGEPALRHSGGMPGVSTQLVVLPESRRAVAVLSNGGSRGATSRALDAVLDAMLGSSEGPSTGSDLPPQRWPAGTYRGQIAHPDGPLPLVLVLGEKPTVRIGAGDVTRCGARFGPSGFELRCRHRMQLGRGPLDLADLAFRFEVEDGGAAVRGVVYATLDGVCRLPFWFDTALEQPKVDGTLRVISYNVLVGFRDSDVSRFLPGCQREQRISAWLAAERPDVVALQEMNGFDRWRLRRTARAWGHDHVALLEEDGYPVALTSNRPIEVVARHRDGLHHGMLHARTHGIDFVVVHLLPSPDVPRKIVECARALECYQRATGAGSPAVVLGDFNSIAPADVELFSPAALRRYEKWRYLTKDGRPAEVAMTPLLTAGAIDTLLATNSRPEPLPLPRIDFVLCSPDLAAGCIGSRWLCDPERLRLSDHPPVVADFAIVPNASNRK